MATNPAGQGYFQTSTAEPLWRQLDRADPPQIATKSAFQEHFQTSTAEPLWRARYTVKLQSHSGEREREEKIVIEMRREGRREEIM